MTDPLRVALDDAEWIDFDIPDGNMKVRMCVLREEDGSRARTVFVSFPPGWAREQRGSYPCSEELWVIEGAIELSGERYVAGDWAFLPPGHTRFDMRTPDGALALARFSGPARWTREEAGGSA